MLFFTYIHVDNAYHLVVSVLPGFYFKFIVGWRKGGGAGRGVWAVKKERTSLVLLTTRRKCGNKDNFSEFNTLHDFSI
jgi:hypothetical protein